jgi:hypothetical protein
MEAYQVRYVDEYNKLCDKYGKLLKLLRKADMGELDFELNCPIELLKEQADVMKRYIDIMLARDKYEKVGLTHYNFNILYGEEYGVY